MRIMHALKKIIWDIKGLTQVCFCYFSEVHKIRLSLLHLSDECNTRVKSSVVLLNFAVKTAKSKL